RRRSQQAFRRRLLRLIGIGRRGRSFFFDAFGDLGEVPRFGEILVDARETNVGDVVERLEAIHHRFADLGALHLIALGFQPTLDAGDHAVDLVRGDIALARSVADRAGELVAVERLSLTVLLDDRQVAKLDAFKGGEAGAAGLTLPASSDRRPILARAAVLYLAVFMGAERAAHLTPGRWESGRTDPARANSPAARRTHYFLARCPSARRARRRPCRRCRGTRPRRSR